nr:MAG TPA: hypothetical protein [Caudoviricetes sp.]
MAAEILSCISSTARKTRLKASFSFFFFLKYCGLLPNKRRSCA